jgi:acetyltransferase-like isoleucine patch superfamily enzyme
LLRQSAECKNFITGIAKKIKKEKYLFFNNKNLNYIKGKITIGLNTIIGSDSIVLLKVNISKKVSIGALSLVNKNINLPSLYSNIPVKKNK